MLLLFFGSYTGDGGVQVSWSVPYWSYFLQRQQRQCRSWVVNPIILLGFMICHSKIAMGTAPQVAMEKTNEHGMARIERTLLS
jgi:hypothetical protein